MKDPKTISMITCKSTGLPLGEVRKIKKILRVAYDRVCITQEVQAMNARGGWVAESAKTAFKQGKSLFCCIGWARQPEGHQYWSDIHQQTRKAFGERRWYA